MALLNAFSETRPRMRLAEIAEVCGLPRGTAHRLVSTLEQLGYVRRRDVIYELTPRVIDLGYAYLASQPLAVVGRDVLVRLSDEVDLAFTQIHDLDEVVVDRVTPDPSLTVPAESAASAKPSRTRN